jgi:DNA-binding MarR family transcriptional regulator
MKNNYNLIKELLLYVENFEAEAPDDQNTIPAFNLWLNAQIIKEQISNEHLLEKSKEDSNRKEGNLVYTYFIELYRFIKHYSKKALSETTLTTVDDYSFISTLAMIDSLSKSDLITRHLMEITSGTEVIKRLLKLELIYEYPDETDKRSKRVSITVKGKALLKEADEKISVVGNILTGNLNSYEQSQLLAMLTKLHTFHTSIYTENKKSELEAIVNKYLPNHIT